MAALSVLAGCAGLSREPPVSTNVTGVPANAQMPQSPNSLPLGSAISAPLLPSNPAPIMLGPNQISVRPL